MSRLDRFVADLAQSGLVRPADLERTRDRLDPDPPEDAAVRLARLLVAQGALTSYQARKVLAGATKGFFLGGYRILKPLGEGGMGKVYLAAREADGLEVAIKVLPPRKAQEEHQAILRFRREMALSQRVRHPNVARTLEVGDQGGIHYMVMEYIRGRSLYDVVRNPKGGPLSVAHAARYFLTALDGLVAAHDAGLIHRDIKPSNLMVTPEGDAKLLDLGLARAIEEEGALTRQNVVIGTLDYASPEQLSDAARADRRSDLYSVGCTLYFALAGRPPFEGGDVVNKIYKQRMEDPEPLERVARGVPAAFGALVRKLMAKDPADRYQDGRELIVDLRRWTDPGAARAFHPPPPEVTEEDLLADGRSGLSLRDLGDAEPAAAPRYRPPPPPRPAVVVAADVPRPLPEIPPPPPAPDDSPWLIRVIVGIIVLGMIAVLIISFFR